MGRKAFEDQPYDPIAADLARDVAAAGRSVAVKVAPAYRPPPSPSPLSVVPPSPVVDRVPVEATQSSAVGSVSTGEEGGPRPIHVPVAREATITKRFVLTRTEDDEFNEFLLRLQRQIGTKVTASVVVRAALTVLMQAEIQVLQEIRGWQVRFPSTHDALAQGTFEAEWIRCLARAVRRAPMRERLG